MTNRYRMSVEDNVLFAKRNIVDSIWKEANVEGIAVTFPETREIFEGRAIRGLKVDETIAINNLKHGWQFVFETLDVPVDIAYVRQVNNLVGSGGIVQDAGQLRMSDVTIGGTKWVPDLPDYNGAKAKIESIYAKEPGQGRALEMFAYLCRAQLFHDGNKRTAQLVANRMLVADGAGVLAIPVDGKMRFDDLLIRFYETDNSEALLEFLAENALDGIPAPASSRVDPEIPGYLQKIAGRCKGDDSAKTRSHVSLEQEAEAARGASKALEAQENHETPSRGAEPR